MQASILEACLRFGNVFFCWGQFQKKASVKKFTYKAWCFIIDAKLTYRYGGGIH